jgi:hypothetical protein
MNLEDCLKALPKGQVDTLTSNPMLFKHKERNEISMRSAENLEKISRSGLIDKIREYERKETELITHINNLNDVISEGNRAIRRSDSNKKSRE